MVTVGENSSVWGIVVPEGENLCSSLAVAGDWERKGSYRTAWAVPCDSSCTCSYAYGHGLAIGPHTGHAVLATASLVCGGLSHP